MRLGRAAARLVVFLGFGLLSACNVVMTREPLFAGAAAGAPPLRPGVWEFFREPGCKVDERQPLTMWPSCAGGGVASADEIAGRKGGVGSTQMVRTPIVLASGDPRILQIQVSIDMKVGAEASASGGATATATGSEASAKPYGYAAVKPTKLDAQGRITAFRFWPVLCGPPPPANSDDLLPGAATHDPLPGLEMKPGAANCTTGSVDALRNAAQASLAWDTDKREAHWVRDGDR